MTRGAWLLVVAAVLVVVGYSVWRTDAAQHHLYLFRQTWLQVRQGHFGYSVHWSRRGSDRGQKDEHGQTGPRPE